jgi:iron complex transport system substrate-binding protein
MALNFLFRWGLLCGLLGGLTCAFAATSERKVTDDMGQTLTLPAAPQRIVSLAPGATEMLFAAGAGDRIVATVQFSDQPEQAKHIPRIGDVTAVDLERLISLRPDVVVAWPGGGNPAQIERLHQLGIPVYQQQVNTLSDVAPSLRRLGSLAGTGDVADRSARAVEQRLSQLVAQYGRARNSAGKQPSALLQIWNKPIYTVGGTQLMSDSLRVCGVRNAFGELRDLAPVVDVEAVIARNPDMIIAVAPGGEAATWLADWKRFPNLSAVRDGRLIPFEDERLSRLGPSVIEATAALCARIAASAPAQSR